MATPLCPRDLNYQKGAHLLTEPLPPTMMQYDLTPKVTQFGGGMILSSRILAN